MSKDSKKPAIRFKGFTDDWEQRKFTKIAERLSESAISDNDNPCVEYEDVIADSGELNKDIFSKNIEKKGIKFTSENVLYGKLRPYLHNWLNPDFKGVAVGDWWVLKPISTDKNFLYRIIQTDRFDNAANQSVGTKMPRADWKLISNLEISIPTSLKEQEKIGAFFNSLDNLITLHQRKLDKLKNIKKALLEKMFPRNGENIPEVRFKGFSDDWEQRKFSEITETRRGLTYRPENVKESGIRVLRSSNINEDTFVFSNEDVFVEPSAVKIPLAKNGDILITSANGSSRLVGKHSIIRELAEESAVHGGFMLLASAEEPEFVNALMDSAWYIKFINTFVAGGNGAIGNLNKSDLDNQMVRVPSVGEQRKIGNLFKQIDNTITLHQRKLDKLKNIKKALLEKMFV